MEENNDRILFTRNDDFDNIKNDLMITQHENGKVEVIYNTSIEGVFGINDGRDYRSHVNESANKSWSQRYDNLKDFGISFGNHDFGYYVPLWDYITITDLERIYMRANDDHKIDDFRKMFSNFTMNLFS